MNAEIFIDLIKNPAQLYKVSYTELKQLVSQYPYCQNLRYLLLKKCIMENHEDYDENLQLAATFSNDRSNLFKQIRMEQSDLRKREVMLGKEEKIELEESPKEETAPNQIEKTNENIETEKVETIHFNSNIKTLIPDNSSENEEPILIEQEEDNLQNTPVYFDENDADTEIEDITEEIELEYDFESSPATLNDPEEEYENVISIEELIELDSASHFKKPVGRTEILSDKTAEQKKQELEFSNEPEINPGVNKTPPPTPKSSFGSWVKQFQEAETSGKKSKEDKRKKEKKKLKKKDFVSKKQKKKKRSKKGKKSLISAEQSLKVNKEIVSETLAKLLASQGSFEESIEMFEKLRLIFPKKSSYFANQIKKLKK